MVLLCTYYYITSGGTQCHIGDAKVDHLIKVMTIISHCCKNTLFLLQLVSNLWGDTLTPCEYPVAQTNFHLMILLAPIDDPCLIN